MANLNDFDLDVTQKNKVPGAEVQWKSKSLCTPGCITGILQTCAIQTATCGCSIG